ncbi:hypothetical protein [Halomonas denitrificans]|nr:hypothetical protein [Halomonas denitrificans]
MSESPNPIRLVAGIELRPPSPDARFVLEREHAERVGGAIGDDLARCVPAVTGAHLVTGPALLEPGQVLSPDHSPWNAIEVVAGPRREPAPGLTTLGAASGRLSHETLGPYRGVPDGLFVCLPMLLFAPPGERETLDTALERELFDHGGLHPPSLAALAETTGLEPVHGQLMTLTDLAALVKMQLAGAGLDPFWPPVEHALLAPDEPARLDLPAGLRADWSVEDRGWELALRNPADPPDDDDALWLRAFRQTTVLLETHLIPWRATVGDPDARLDPDNRWVRFDRGADDGNDRIEPVNHPDVGLVGFEAVAAGRRTLALPLVADAIAELRTRLEQERGASAPHDGA